MSQNESLTTRDLLTMLVLESRSNSTMLSQIHGAQSGRWEYLVVIVHAQKERWYEYYANGQKLVDLDNKPIYTVFNTLGSDGWELIGIMPSGDFYFKRPVRE